MLFILTILSLTSYALILRKGMSTQNFFLVSLIYSYQFILLVSVYLSIPLDIFEDSDDPVLRFELARLNLLFFFSIYAGQLMESRVSRAFTSRKDFRQNGLPVQLLFFLLILIAVAQIIIMPPRVFSGEYSNEKPGYYFEYFTIFFCLYFSKASPKGLLKLAPFITFCLTCVLAGERLMLITAVSAYIYFLQPYKVTLKAFLILVGALFFILQIDSLRSGSQGSGLLNSFIFTEEVTHHGSLLYSSLVLLEYGSNSPVSISSLSNSFSFLLGLDESTQGFGLAEEIATFGRRGGGGFLPSYLVVLFGNVFGPIATLLSGVFIGVLIQAHAQGKKLGFVSLVFLAFSAHFIIYTPVLLLKPVIFALVISVFWSLFIQLQPLAAKPKPARLKGPHVSTES